LLSEGWEEMTHSERRRVTNLSLDKKTFKFAHNFMKHFQLEKIELPKEKSVDFTVTMFKP
jgi:hypothetical protein